MLGEMFSRHEMYMFMACFVGLIVTIFLLYVVISACEKLVRSQAKKKMAEHKVDRVYEVNKNDFYELGEAALRHQRMLSFITETNTGTVEITIDEILEEVHERCGQREN